MNFNKFWIRCIIAVLISQLTSILLCSYLSIIFLNLHINETIISYSSSHVSLSVSCLIALNKDNENMF